MKPKEIAHMYLDRHNAHDVDGVMALFADDATYEIPGRVTRRGKPEIRVTEEWEAAVHDNIQAAEIIEAGDEVSFRAHEANDWLSASGVRELEYTSMTIEVAGDHITHVTAALPPDALKRTQRQR